MIDTNSREFQVGVAAYESEPFVKGLVGRATDFHGSKVAKLRAFLEAYLAAKPSEWQPIASAPEGEDVMLWGCWTDSVGTWYDKIWREGRHWYSGGNIVYPHMWARLPEPPKEGA